MRNSYVWKSSLRLHHNQLIARKSTISSSRIDMEGHGNCVEINGGGFYKTDVKIVGRNNIMISNNAKLNFVKIIIRGNNCKVEIGEETTIGGAHMVCMGVDNSIVVGKDCMFSDGIEIWNTDTHPIFNDTGEIINESRPIVIGNHVWACKGTTILKGVKIGDNSIIGMNSLVTKDVQANTLNVGSPCREIKKGINWSRSFIDK